MIANAPVEIAMIAYLAEDQLLVGLDHVVGELDSVVVSPREVAAAALRHDARQVIVAHNHPSGDPHPSNGDVALARGLSRALAAIEVQLVDMLILTDSETTSMRTLGLL